MRSAQSAALHCPRRALARPADERNRKLKSLFKLRYEVYCLERGYLPRDDYPHGHESDEHDVASEHFGAFDSNDEPIGYVRLVRSGSNGFPFEQHCTDLVPDLRLPRGDDAAEISRLMVRQDHRVARGDSGPRAPSLEPVPSQASAARSARILLHLYRQMYAYSIANGVRWWYAAMERPLARFLRQWDFGFQQIGPETDYFGPVAPYMANLRDLEKRVGASNPQLLAWMQSSELSPRETTEWQFRHIRHPEHPLGAVPPSRPLPASVTLRSTEPALAEPVLAGLRKAA